MAQVVGALATSHSPQLIMPARQWGDLPPRTKGPFNPKKDIAKELTDEAKVAKEQRCQDALGALSAHLYRLQPDALIVIGDDQQENILDDNQPPFLIYMGDTVEATLHFLYLGAKAEDQMSSYNVASDCARLLHQGLMDRGFDPAWSTTTREETGLGHAFGRSLHFLMPDSRFPILPIMVNSLYPPTPSAERCFRFGEAIREAVNAMPVDARVVLLGSGGLSHFIIDEELDTKFTGAMERRDEDFIFSLSPSTLVSGTAELLTWITVAGAMRSGAEMIDYVPCYRSDKGVGCAMGFAFWEE